MSPGFDGELSLHQDRFYFLRDGSDDGAHCYWIARGERAPGLEFRQRQHAIDKFLEFEGREFEGR
jgi:hypothetical protein